MKGEFAVPVEHLRFFASAVGSIAGRSNPIGGSLLFYSHKEPVGVCGQIVPWNYPLLMTTWKLAPALAAGCTVVLKPDPQTPLSALRLAELAAEVGFPPGVINIVPGDGPTTGAYLVKHPGVDKVAFTGSTKTGGEIMRLCSDPIKRLTLELGGKSPNLVFADADLADAIPSAAWSIFNGAGQSCEARSRLLVEQSIYDDVVSELADNAGGSRVGDPLDPETQIGSLISINHRERVHGFVERGRERGRRGRARRRARGREGRVLSTDRAREGRQHDGGRAGGDLRAGRDGDPVRGREGCRRGSRTRRSTASSRRSGPAIPRADTGWRGRSSPAWSAINHPYTSFPGIPFGGYKQSGFGRELGLETLELYLETKSVARLHLAEAVQPVRPLASPSHR